MAVNVAAKPTLLAVRLMTGLFLYLAYASPIAAKMLQKTRLGITDVSFTFLPHILAKDAGIFRKHGMDVELIYVGGPVSISAMAAGELDYNAAPDPGMLATARGVPTKAVMFTTNARPCTSSPNPGLKKSNSLRGKNWALPASAARLITLPGRCRKKAASIPIKSLISRWDRIAPG